MSNKIMDKTNIIPVLGFFSGLLQVFGCYPFGLALFATAYANELYRWLMMPVILAGMYLRKERILLCKYGIAMVLVIILTEMSESRKNNEGKNVKVAFIAANSLLAMTLTEGLLGFSQGTALLMGIGESFFVFGLTLLFTQMMEWMQFLGKREKETAEIIHGPGKEKLRESAEVFSRLAKQFQSMPSRKEMLTKQDLDDMFEELSQQFCITCEKQKECWQVHYLDTCKNTYEIFSHIEQTGEAAAAEMVPGLSKQCIHYKNYLSETKRIFERAKTNLMWHNRLIESREAVAGQLSEMARMLLFVADDIYDVTDAGKRTESILRTRLRAHHIKVIKLSVLEKQDNLLKVYITMKTERHRCIAVKDVAGVVSDVYGRRVVPDKDSKLYMNEEESTILFIEDTSYQVLYGMSRAVKYTESISGDNFSFLFNGTGQFTASLSDGMGSGYRASKESEAVVDMLERFLEAGFCKETAVKMINSTMVMNNQDSSYSTIDICSIDLYTGVCEFLKLGAARTYIKRENSVETIQTSSLPIGVFHQLEIETCVKKLFHGDYVIMVSDGVVESLEQGSTEPIEKMLMDLTAVSPKEIANDILEQALLACDGRPMDDMTVMVTGIWKK